MLHMPQDLSNDIVLLASLKARDIKAFDYLYHHARNRLHVLAYSIINDREAARDLVQDFFIDFWQKRSYENIRGSLSAYLVCAVRNRAIKYNHKQATLFRLKGRAPAMPVVNEAVAEQKMENSELKLRIETAIRKLPPTAARVFQLHYIEHLSHAEISQKLGITRSTVSNHISRALKELRLTLKKGD